MIFEQIRWFSWLEKRMNKIKELRLIIELELHLLEISLRWLYEHLYI